MARIALRIAACAALALAAGCTWTETYNEYPPSAYTTQHAHGPIGPPPPIPAGLQ